MHVCTHLYIGFYICEGRIECVFFIISLGEHIRVGKHLHIFRLFCCCFECIAHVVLGECEEDNLLYFNTNEFGSSFSPVTRRSRENVALFFSPCRPG